jgi:hypothetical protein
MASFLLPSWTGECMDNDVSEVSRESFIQSATNLMVMTEASKIKPSTVTIQGAKNLLTLLKRGGSYVPSDRDAIFFLTSMPSYDRLDLPWEPTIQGTNPSTAVSTNAQITPQDNESDRFSVSGEGRSCSQAEMKAEKHARLQSEIETMENEISVREKKIESTQIEADFHYDLYEQARSFARTEIRNKLLTGSETIEDFRDNIIRTERVLLKLKDEYETRENTIETINRETEEMILEIETRQEKIREIKEKEKEKGVRNDAL